MKKNALKGMKFLSTGSFSYSKAVKDFVSDNGGEWVKTSKQATAALNGRAEIFHTSNWTKKIWEILEQQKPVVVLEMDFTDGKQSTPEMLQTFLDKLRVARGVAREHIKDGATAADVSKAFRVAFPSIKFTYEPDTAAQFWTDPTVTHSADEVTGTVLRPRTRGPAGLTWDGPRP